VRFGKQKPGTSSNGKRNASSAIYVRVPSTGVVCTDVGLALGLAWGLMQHAGEAGAGKDGEVMGASRTSSRSLCGLCRSGSTRSAPSRGIYLHGVCRPDVGCMGRVDSCNVDGPRPPPLL
jgi:hypothetical protein